MRTAKRFAYVVMLAFIVTVLPIYALLFRLSVVELSVALGPAVLTFAAVEMASRWEYRMRRRHAYPHMLGYRLAAIHDFDDACQEATKLLSEFLRPAAVVISWLSEDGQELETVATHGMPPGWSSPTGPLSPSAAMREAVAGRTVLARHSPKDDPWFAGVFPDAHVVYVALVSQDRPQGLLAMATAHRNTIIGDHRLLSSLGMVTALALHNCRLYEGERASARHLQEVNRMKSDFLITISHELRTPLTSVRTAAEMLLEEEEKADYEGVRARLARSIAKGANRLTSLVAELVDVSREDQFAPRLELEPQPVQEMISGATALVSPLLTTKQQTLTVDIVDPDSIVLIDRRRFEQVIVNLLANAQRHTPQGGAISVRIFDRGSEVVLAVRDTGPGVAENERELVFEPFFRGDSSGLGLGLAIARSVVELHSGRIWVENNTDGPGATFSVALSRHTPGRRKAKRRAPKASATA